MSTKTIQTRIKNKVDLYSNWKDVTGLLDGEIALVRVPTGETYTNPVTGKAEPVVELLMKVGDGEHDFNDLPWLSAKASDVYNWAKTDKAENVKVITTKVVDGKTVVDQEKTLKEWFSSLSSSQAIQDAAIEALTGRLDELTDSSKAGSIAKAIEGAIANLDYTDSGEGFVTAVSQANGVISVTKTALPTADNNTAGIMTLGVTGGAATHDSIFGTNGLSATVSQNTAAIEAIQGAIAGGVHFIGTTSTELEDNATTTPITISGQENSYTPANGDIVIYDNKEFIWVKIEATEGAEDTSHWEELGDLTLAGQLSDWRQELNYTEVTDGAATNNKFVTKVTQSDGKIAVNYARPTADDVAYGSSDTVATYLDNHIGKLEAKVNLTDGETVTGKIAAAIEALDYTSPVTSGNTTDYQFIATVSQTDGTIAATKATIPDASSTVKGVVKLSDTITGEVAAGDSATAASTAAVKTVQAANAGLQTRVEAVEGNYVKFTADATDNTKGTLTIGKDGSDIIIFDCGSAADI